MHYVKSFLGAIPKYLLWLIASTVLWLWIFTMLTDVPMSKKVTLLASVPALQDPALGVELEQAMPEGIRMVKAHSFDYFVFSNAEISEGDLVILPESKISEYLGNFTALDSACLPEGLRCCTVGGKPYGILVYDAAAGTGIAGSYIDYNDPELPGENYFLFLTGASLHGSSGDGAVYPILNAFLKLP